MRLLTGIVALALAISLISCGESNPVDNHQPDDRFLFRVEIKDAGNNPVQDIRVSIWNKFLDFEKMSSGGVSGEFNPDPNGLTIMTLQKPLACRADLTIRDLGNDVVRVFSSDTSEAGVTQYTWTPDPTVHSGVYKCIASTFDLDTDDPLFTDSIWMMFWQPDPAVSVLGFSDETGVYETRDSLWFPNLFDIPDIKITTELSPTVVAEIALSDTVVITLTDTLTSMQMQVEREVTKGENIFDIVWSPSLVDIPETPDPIDQTEIERSPMENPYPPPVPNEFEILQNYPNPFN
jgi:hypothetical protein